MQSSLLDTPPLPDELIAVWHDILVSWESGLRKKAIRSAETLVARLSPTDPEERARFGRWLCERLFNDSSGWKGQWGGGGGYERARDYVLSMFPLTTGVIIPHLGQELQKPSGQTLRWLYQATVGLGGRLPPAARHQLEEMLISSCGQGAGWLELLRLAAADDERARQWLADIESDDHQCGPLWIPWD